MLSGRLWLPLPSRLHFLNFETFAKIYMSAFSQPFPINFSPHSRILKHLCLSLSKRKWEGGAKHSRAFSLRFIACTRTFHTGVLPTETIAFSQTCDFRHLNYSFTYSHASRSRAELEADYSSARPSVRSCVPLLGEAQNLGFCTILSEISENHLCILRYLADVALKAHHKIATFFVKCSKHIIKW